MKILRIPDVEYLTTSPQLINTTCPFCGETEPFNSFGATKGIRCVKKIWFRRFPKMTRLTQREVYCYTCGAKWKESKTKERIIL